MEAVQKKEKADVEKRTRHATRAYCCVLCGGHDLWKSKQYVQ